MIMGVLSLTLCQPPTPRIARVEAPPCAVTAIATTAQSIPAACDSTAPAVQIRDLDGRLSPSRSTLGRMSSGTQKLCRNQEPQTAWRDQCPSTFLRRFSRSWSA